MSGGFTFGGSNTPNANNKPLFGASTTAGTTSSLFGGASKTATSGSSTPGGIFGGGGNTGASNPFGSVSATPAVSNPGGLFGGAQATASSTAAPTFGGALGGAGGGASKPSLFGGASTGGAPTSSTPSFSFSNAGGSFSDPKCTSVRRYVQSANVYRNSFYSRREQDIFSPVDNTSRAPTRKQHVRWWSGQPAWHKSALLFRAETSNDFRIFHSEHVWNGSLQCYASGKADKQ